MDLLSPVLFRDDWGSRVFLASLQQRPIPSDSPESELWMGAHEVGPAGLTRHGSRTTLAQVIAADPDTELGEDCRRRFGDRLPFLLKVLAPGRAISIQVHPSAHQARAERARSGDAVYGDDWAKPELLLAISPFEVFVGMRRHAEVAALANALGVPSFSDLVTRSATDPRPEHALLSAILATPAPNVAELVQEVVAACVRLESVGGALGAMAAAVVSVAEDHADDIGMVVLLLMHHRTLAPGEYLDVAAGVLHSYVRGLGIEVLANSDNVVRAGLTSKPVNVPELLAIVDEHADGIAGAGSERAPGVVEYVSASDRFRLTKIVPGRELPASAGPRIVFCLEGAVSLDDGEHCLELTDAQAAFIPAATLDVRLQGAGEVYCVLVPQ
ncbi:MAG: mannose-6-phosphate isomerase, class I [Phycicoccus sp.]|nr:mannose-6-phosphate isomerase, class I [Phycicoccus sp.]